MEPIKVVVKFGYPRTLDFEDLTKEMKAKIGGATQHYVKRDMFVEDETTNVIYHEPKAIFSKGHGAGMIKGVIKQELNKDEKFISALKEKLLQSAVSDEEKEVIKNTPISKLFTIVETNIL